MKILLVEDDEVDRMAFERFVERENLPYEYTLADSVAGASEVLRSQEFDVILLDYNLGDGTGVPPEYLEQVFTPFRGESGGTGIGLATVEKIVKLYGGEVRAYNDDGACFEFSLKDYVTPGSDTLLS